MFIFAIEMRKSLFRYVLTSVVLCLSLTVFGQSDDSRCADFLGIPMEGPSAAFVQRLKEKGFVEWGTSEDSTDLYFRGDYYGLRAKLVVSIDEQTHFVSTALVTVGPYRTAELHNRNFSYFRLKLEEQYGKMDEHDDGSLLAMTDYGMVKLSTLDGDDGTRTIHIFYFGTAPFYKDALSKGFRGNVQEVITENAVAEESMESYTKDGKLVKDDLQEREYDAYGYLLKAKKKEPSGYLSTITYTYDADHRLTRRTLVNEGEGIRYINDYTYNHRDEIVKESQKVFDKLSECILSIYMENRYTSHDEMGNWTTNELNLKYWEKGGQVQEVNTTQKRTISYWE